MIEVLDFISEHKKAVIAVAAMILCLLISGGIANSFTKRSDAAEGSLTKVENEISAVQDQLNQPKTKYKELDHGYHKDRVDSDTATIIGKGTGNGNTNEWLSRFLTWSSGAEYNENRNWFVEKLGSNNVFCTEIMRPYDTELSMDGSAVVDPDKVQCQLTDTKVYVNSINENTGVYDYVIFAYFNGKTAFSNNAFNALDRVQCYIITVSTDAEGNVLPDTFIVSAGPTANFM